MLRHRAITRIDDGETALMTREASDSICGARGASRAERRATTTRVLPAEPASAAQAAAATQKTTAEDPHRSIMT